MEYEISPATLTFDFSPTIPVDEIVAKLHPKLRTRKLAATLTETSCFQSRARSSPVTFIPRQLYNYCISNGNIKDIMVEMENDMFMSEIPFNWKKSRESFVHNWSAEFLLKYNGEFFDVHETCMFWDNFIFITPKLK